MTRTISVIIPCYNCEDCIEANVLAILQSTLAPLEIILVDDCSTDGTPARLESLSRANPGKLRVLRTPRNGGPGRARNEGAKAARGEHLFFVDSDVVILPDALERFAERVEECDAVVGVYTDRPTNSGFSPRYKALLYSYLLGQSGVRPYDQFSASCAGIRAAVYRELGGYDDWFEPGVDFENEEFGHRISGRFRMVLDPAVRGHHRFPGFLKMTRTFFHRTALWVEMFTVRRRFSTLAETPKTGLSSMALLGAILLLPLAFAAPWGFLPSLGSYLLHLAGFLGFFLFVVRRRPTSFLPVFLLNHYYTTVIACGAVMGAVRTVLGRSDVAHRFGARQATRPSITSLHDKKPAPSATPVASEQEPS